MIKYISSAQLSLAQKNFYYKFHTHIDETVFLASPAPEFLNQRAYNLCKLCGNLVSIPIDAELAAEIKTVLDKKLTNR